MRLVVCAPLLFAACWVTPAEVRSKLDVEPVTDGDADADADADSDADTDTDSGLTTGLPTGTTTTALLCVDESLGSSVGPNVSSGTTAGAGNDEQGECGGSVPSTGNDLVFEWVAPNSGCFAFDTVGSGYDTALYVRQNDCNGPELACNDDRSSTQTTSELGLQVTSGTTYLLILDGYDAGDNGTYQINIGVTAPIATDLDIGSATGANSASTVGEDTTLNPTTCPVGPGGNDLLLGWTAPSAGTFTFSLTQGGTTFDTILSLHRQCTTTEIECADVFDPYLPFGGESIAAPLLSGEFVIIRVAGFYSATGTFELQIQ